MALPQLTHAQTVDAAAYAAIQAQHPAMLATLRELSASGLTPARIAARVCKSPNMSSADRLFFKNNVLGCLAHMGRTQ